VTLRILVAGILAAAAAACGGSGAGNDGGPGGDGGVTAECTSSDDCTPPEVCQPFSQTCEEPGGACSSQSDCSDGTYCELSLGVCLPSSPGTPCETGDNCSSGECLDGVCGCDGVAHEAQLEGGPLDVFLVLDRTASMGADCDYDPANDPTPPVSSKACFATYALADYVVNVSPMVDTRLAFQVMSLSNDCTGATYDPALIPFTSLPAGANSTLVQRISSEDFSGGFGTRIEGALRGIASYTVNNQTSGREIIGVLITDGDATDCDTNTANLAQIIQDHRDATGIRTFIIGMEGATEATLEQLAIAGGADPHDDFCGGVATPCHYWNVGNGSGDALSSALQAIAAQAVPLPCEIDVTGLMPPPGEALDYGRVNVTFTEGSVTTTIPQVPDAASCPSDQPAWYYDNPASPTRIILCQFACDAVTAAGNGATLDVVAGCTDTVVVP
jgi:hypothetical protein